MGERATAWNLEFPLVIKSYPLHRDTVVSVGRGEHRWRLGRGADERRRIRSGLKESKGRVTRV